MSDSIGYDSPEAKIMRAVAAALEGGADPSSAARLAAPDLSVQAYRELVAGLADSGYLRAHVESARLGKDALVLEGLGSRGTELVRGWRAIAGPVQTLALIQRLAKKPEADIEAFFIAHGLGQAFASPGKGWGRLKRVNAALAEAEREGRRDEVLHAARTAFGFDTEAEEARPVAADVNATVVAASEDRRRWVFLVQGRNRPSINAITALLESAGLRVLEWEKAVRETMRAKNTGAPYIGDILSVGMERCHAIVVLFTPDDIGYLHPALFDPERDDPAEAEPRGRARQNVVFEAGFALAAYEKVTVFVELGRVAGFSDLAGRHAIRLDDSPQSRKALLERLAVVEADVDLTGERWMSAGDIAGALASMEPVGVDVAVSGRDPQPDSPDADRSPSSAIAQWRPGGVQGSHPTDLVIGSIVQVPGGPSLVHDPSGAMATRLTGEPREELLARLLGDSPLSEWLASVAPAFNVATPVPGWEPAGFNTGEWSELVVEPPGTGARPSVLSMQCRVNTGWVQAGPTRQPGLTLATEVRFRLLELDAQRRPSDIRHETTPAPAPGALKLEELVDALVAAVQIADTAALACEQLTGATPSTGVIGLRLLALSGALDRVIDFTEFRVIPGSGSIPDHGIEAALPFDAVAAGVSDAVSARLLAVDLVAQLLERSGRRGAAARLEALRTKET